MSVFKVSSREGLTGKGDEEQPPASVQNKMITGVYQERVPSLDMEEVDLGEKILDGQPMNRVPTGLVA
jgi:hypothetical protein